MRVLLKVLLVVAGLCAVGLAFVIWVASSLGSGMCGSTLLFEVPSPDAARRAVVYERNCGATTGFATHVSILAPGDSAGAEAGNAFVADTDHGQAPAGPGGGPAVAVRWLGPRELEIQHHPATRTFAADTLVAGVRIRYVRSHEAGRLTPLRSSRASRRAVAWRGRGVGGVQVPAAVAVPDHLAGDVAQRRPYTITG